MSHYPLDNEHAVPQQRHFKGKMIRLHLKYGVTLEGIYASDWKNKLLLAHVVGKRIHLLSIARERIIELELLRGLSLFEEKSICNFLYASEN